MIAAAGTGGHIYPGIAVSDFFQKKGFSVSWLGTPYGMENNLLDKEKVMFSPLLISGIRRKGILNWLKLPIVIIISFIQALKAIVIAKPLVVILMGGYVCMPAALAAKLLNIKIIVHEQNVVPGLTNKILSKIAIKTFCAFPNSIDGSEVIGNPIRNKIYGIKRPKNRFQNRTGPLRVLIVGGSLGANCFNNELPQIFELISKKLNISIIHQSGEVHYNKLSKAYKNIKFPVKIKKFIHNIHDDYEWADIVIARSGALTVSEFLEAGIASILIPYPFAVDNHQYFNAKILEAKGGAIIIEQTNFSDGLIKVFSKINRKLCMSMALKARNESSQTPINNMYNYFSELI